MYIYRLLVGLALLVACGKVGTSGPDARVLEFTTTITASGNGVGTITSTPAGIHCGTDCNEAFAEGTAVTLHATPDSDSVFVGWAGEACSGTGDCTINVTGDLAIQAMFALKNSVVVTVTGNGVGTVTSVPAGINCPGDCSQAYGPGQMVTLTPTAGAHSNFDGWSGGGCTGTAPCTISTDMAVGVVATFKLDQHDLTIAKAGNGAGTVTSNPVGISCGSTCSANYDYGSVVTLMATASAGTTFAGWSGGGCSGTGTCDVTVSTAIAVTATFTLNQYMLTVNKAGSSAGTVTSNPVGINCGSTCAANFNYGTNIVLTAVPGTSSTFMGWSGSCSGTGTCTVSMSATRNVTATFNASLSCTTVSDASACTNGSLPEINLGLMTSVACHNQCQTAMPAAGMTSGCWVLTGNSTGNCYCRNGVLVTGGSVPGGTCN